MIAFSKPQTLPTRLWLGRKRKYGWHRVLSPMAYIINQVIAYSIGFLHL